MTELCYLDGIKSKTRFTRQDILQSFRDGGFGLSDTSFCKKLESMIKEGEIVRVGRNVYCFPKGDKVVYKHEYSELAKEVAMLIRERYPLLEFSILELI